MAGFPVGAVVGGLVAAPLVGMLGRTEGLLLVTALAQAAFAALVVGDRASGMPRSWLSTPPRRPRAVGAAGRGRRRGSRHPSAAGDPVRRAHPRLPGALGPGRASSPSTSCSTGRPRSSRRLHDLARFLAGYTAVMNVVSIVFLVARGGPADASLRPPPRDRGQPGRPHGVRGRSMLAVLAVTGGASVALLVTVSAARILDIALTDGTTRTSINAMYQVLPERPAAAGAGHHRGDRGAGGHQRVRRPRASCSTPCPRRCPRSS